MVSTQAAINFAVENSLPEIILATKLYIPQPRPNLVSRPRLIAQLNAALTRPPGVIFISAPPGFGKTTLLGEWIANFRLPILDLGLEKDAKPKIQIAWLSLDEEDNDARRFLVYCVAALQTIWPGLGQSVIAQLHHMPADPLIATLINEIATITEPFIFVFDDYHAIQNPLIHHSLAFLLDNLPPQVHLVITTRTHPPLSLARLRSRGQLTELDAADLRFTPDEVSIFLNSVMGLNLPPAEIHALESRTEGWIAGLQMAALSMRGIKDTAGFVKNFTGSHRYILDYLLEEVLNRQPEPVQQFLLQTSILERMCGPLCDALFSRGAGEQESGREMTSLPLNGQETLEHLEAANLFIIPLDDERRWYRYHHLFADLLRHRLAQQTEAQNLAALHRRASDWFEQNSLPTEAMGHALAAVDVARIVRLARQKAETLLSRSELVTLLSWLDSLPEALARSRPRLWLLQAWALVLTGQLQGVEEYLHQAEREFAESSDVNQTDLLGEVATLRATLAYFQRDMPQAIKGYQQALEHLSPDNLFLRGIVMQCLGAAQSWCGFVSQATHAFTEAGTLNQQSGNLQVALIARWNLGQLHVEQGYLQQAAQIYRQTLQLVDEQSSPHREELLTSTARIQVGLAEVSYQWNDLKAAAQHLEAGIRLAGQGQESGALAGAALARARLKQAQGDLPGALVSIQQATYFARRYTGPRYLAAQAMNGQVRLWLMQSKLRAAANWVREQNLQPTPAPHEIPYLAEENYLLLVRLLLAQHQQADAPVLPVGSPLEVALALLEKIIAAAGESKRIGRTIEALILQALVFDAQANGSRALDALAQALTLAEPEGYIRCFVDEGEPMAALLEQAAASGIAPPYVAKLRAAFTLPSSHSALLLDPLSERELEILHFIATGMSNQELADTLVVTVGTVKWHLNNIYSKLAVKSRTQAVARARELGLL